MTPTPIRVLLDENIPVELKEWLQSRQPLWEVSHVFDVELEHQPDSEVFSWAHANGYLVITFDKTFANGRDFAVGSHHGLIRLRIVPTGADEAVAAPLSHCSRGLTKNYCRVRKLS